MAEPVPEKLKNKEDAIFFIEINIEARAKKIEVTKNKTGEGYIGTAGPHPE